MSICRSISRPRRGRPIASAQAEEQAVVDDLRHAKEFGLAAITDLSAPGWGRDPVALRRISEQAGVAVVCAAGFYWDPFPAIAINGTVEQLRDIMIAEIETGVGATGIRCGVIKVGTSRGEPDDVAERLFRAAAAAAVGDRRAGHHPYVEPRSGGVACAGARARRNGFVARGDQPHGRGARRGASSSSSRAPACSWASTRSAFRRGRPMISSPIWCATPASGDSSGSSSCRRISRAGRLLRRYGGRGYSTVLADFVPMLSASRDIAVADRDHAARQSGAAPDIVAARPQVDAAAASEPDRTCKAADEHAQRDGRAFGTVLAGCRMDDRPARLGAGAEQPRRRDRHLCRARIARSA